MAASVGIAQPNRPTQRAAPTSCPAGMVGSYPNCTRPVGNQAAVGGGGGTGCIGGAALVQARVGNAIKSVCPENAPAAATTPGAAPTAPAWQPSAVARPELNPLNPQAPYDPEMQAELASRRSYTQDLKNNTGFAEDVRVQQQRDTSESELAQAKAASIAQGIPFDEQAWRTQQAQAANKVGADVALQRESMVGESLGQSAGQAGAQATERDTRKELDLRAQMGQNEEQLDRYGKDISKYGIDAQAATAANTALMDFYAKLTSGAFGAVGNVGNMSNNYSFS